MIKPPSKIDGYVTTKEIYKWVAEIGEKIGAKKIVLFGSRARGDNYPRSDIDLAIYGMDDIDKQAAFSSEIEKLPTLLPFDLVFICERTSPKLIENINEDGVIIYEKQI